MLVSMRPGIFGRIAGHCLILVALEVALDCRRSQKLLDPFRFVESFVNAEANFGSKF
jgi:hypothetical protein